MTTTAIKAMLTAKTKPPPASLKLSTGSTLLNLACTGSPDHGLISGLLYLFVGQSKAGKTMLARTILAEAANDPAFAKHRLVYRDVERGALMDTEKFFGSKLKKRLETVYSESPEEYYYSLADQFKAKEPFIDVLDSMDALRPEADDKKFAKRKRAFGKGEEAAGDYGTAKARLNSGNLNKVCSSLRRGGKSIVIIIAQARDRIGFGFEPETRSGGRALTFFASIELWFSLKGKIKRNVMGKRRSVGDLCKIAVKKNRIVGKDRAILTPIYYAHGVADTDSMVHWLVEEGFWKGNDTNVQAPEFDHDGTVEKLVCKIESEGKEEQLKDLVTEHWDNLEAACAVTRKKRYA